MLEGFMPKENVVLDKIILFVFMAFFCTAVLTEQDRAELKVHESFVNVFCRGLTAAQKNAIIKR